MVIPPAMVNLFDVLPDELLISIFKFLPLESVLNCERVCQRWRSLARDVELWNRLVMVVKNNPKDKHSNIKSLYLLSSHSEYIRRLEIHNIDDELVTDRIVQECTNLTSLDLVNCHVGNELETSVRKWKKLERLNLRGCQLKRSTDLNIQYDCFQRLNYLALSNFGVNSANANGLLLCNNLSHIYLDEIRKIDVEFVQKLIVSKKNILVTLHIYGDESVDDTCVQLLSECPLLEDLAILKCCRLTDSALVALTNFKRLEHLNIWENSTFSVTCIEQTLKSPNLQMLKSLSLSEIQNLLKSLSLSEIQNLAPLAIDFISKHFTNLECLDLYQ